MVSNQKENTRAAVIAIIIKDPDRAGDVNAILHATSLSAEWESRIAGKT